MLHRIMEANFEIPQLALGGVHVEPHVLNFEIA